MRVKKLINELKKYNPRARVSVIVNNHAEEFSITFGNSEGVEKSNCQEVNFFTMEDVEDK